MPYMLRRLASYFAGLFIISLGIATAVRSNLGATANSAPTYALSVATGLSMGTCVILVYTLYIALQAVLLRRDFKPVRLLQLPVSILFGLFVDLSGLLVSHIQPVNYPVRLAMLAASLVCMAAGVFFYLPAGLVLLPVEGLTQAVTVRLGRFPFHSMKIAFDCASVVAGVLISLLCTGSVTGFREGTVIIAVFTGKLLGVINSRFEKKLRTLLYGPVEESAGPAAQAPPPDPRRTA